MMKNVTIIVVMGGLVLAGSGVAMGGIPTPYTYGSGTSELVETTNARPGGDDWCFELYYPYTGAIHYAGLKVTALGDPTVADFDGWSYWTKGPPSFPGQTKGVNFWMFLDTPHENYPDRDYDIMLGIMPYNVYGGPSQPVYGEWNNLLSSTPYPYQVWSPSGGYDISMWDPDPENMTTWSEFQALDATIWGQDYDFGEAIVRMVIMRSGGGGVAEDVTAYLDDFSLNGEDYPIVPVPSAVLLGAMGLGLVGWLKHRSSRKQEA